MDSWEGNDPHPDEEPALAREWQPARGKALTRALREERRDLVAAMDGAAVERARAIARAWVGWGWLVFLVAVMGTLPIIILAIRVAQWLWAWQP